MNRIFVCATKYYVQPFKRLPWDARSRPYARLYCTKKLLNKLQKCTGTRTKNFFFYEQKFGMLLQKIADTRGVGISNMSKSIYLLTTTPTRHTHLLLTIPIDSTNSH